MDALDRTILDRPPDRPDELPTMLHQSDLQDASAKAAGASASASASASSQQEPTTRPVLASDDVS